jgi:hypothetical protein
MYKKDSDSKEQQQKIKSRQREQHTEEKSPGFGDKKLAGPDQPAT